MVETGASFAYPTFSPVTDLFTKFGFNSVPRPFVKFHHFSFHSPVRFIRLTPTTTNDLHTDFHFFPLQTSSSIYQTINRNYQSRSVSLLFFPIRWFMGASLSTHFLKIKNDFQIVDISMIQSVYVEVLVQVKDQFQVEDHIWVEYSWVHSKWRSYLKLRSRSKVRSQSTLRTRLKLRTQLRLRTLTNLKSKLRSEVKLFKGHQIKSFPEKRISSSAPCTLRCTTTRQTRGEPKWLASSTRTFPSVITTFVARPGYPAQRQSRTNKIFLRKSIRANDGHQVKHHQSQRIVHSADPISSINPSIMQMSYKFSVQTNKVNKLGIRVQQSSPVRL